MKTLFSRILLAQVVAVVLALAVVTVITRYSLNQGFATFLAHQEAVVLENIAPTLANLYQREGGWQALHEEPALWHRVLRSNRVNAGAPRGAAPRARLRPGRAPDGTALEPELRWLAQPGRGMLRERLFLLGADHAYLAGASPFMPGGDDFQSLALQAVEVDDATVGWIGFAPMDEVLPPEARRFLGGQLKITALALAVALAVAALLAWVLARNVSRPVRRIGSAVRRLNDGEYEARAAAEPAGELGTLAAHVNQLADSLQKNRTARQRWMADIAHELRTPLAVMKGEIEAVADGVREVDGQTAASLAEEVEHLAGLVDDLQALALSDAGALSLHKEELELGSLVQQSVEVFRQRLEARGIRLEIHTGAPLRVMADAQRMRQLLHNVLENNSRYTEDGGRVRVTVDGVSLCVEDSGPGVADVQLGQLFDRFYRVEGSRSRATGGSGLGLAICRNIVEAHGGRIEAAHSPLGGLSIRVELPG